MILCTVTCPSSSNSLHKLAMHSQIGLLAYIMDRIETGQALALVMPTSTSVYARHQWIAMLSSDTIGHQWSTITTRNHGI